jgi:hypothetical protein
MRDLIQIATVGNMMVIPDDTVLRPMTAVHHL